MKWSAATRIGGQLVSFCSQLVLARLLTPTEFGTAATAFVIANFALILADLGIGAALIHEAKPTPRFLATAFWLNALLGIIVAAVFEIAASPLTQFLARPEAEGPLRLAALASALAIYAVPLALLEKRLLMRTAGLVELTSVVVGAAVGLLGALNGLGAIALVLMPLVTAVCNSILYLAVTRYVPRGFMGGRELKQIFQFSKGLVGFQVINYFTRNADNLLLARFGTLAGLGFYSRAFALMLLPVTQVQAVIGRVLFPVLTELRHDRERLRRAHMRALLVSAALCAPLSVGVAATSRDFVLAAFGEPWTPMIPMLIILSLTGVQQVYQGTAGILFQVTGRTGLMFKWNLLFTTLTITGFAIGVQWGAIGLCWAVFIRGWALLPLTMVVPLHLIGERLRRVMRRLIPLSACLVLEGSAAFGVGVLLEPLIAFPLVRLIVEAAIGASVFLVALRVLDRPLFRELQRVLRRSGG